MDNLFDGPELGRSSPAAFKVGNMEIAVARGSFKLCFEARALPKPNVSPPIKLDRMWI